jgi:hypothetical protein
MSIIGIALTSLSGWLLIDTIKPALSTLPKLALGWGIGLALVTVGVYLANVLLGVPIAPPLAWAWPVTCAVALVAVRRIVRGRLSPPPRAPVRSRAPWTVLEVWLCAILAIGILITVVQALYWPFFDWDSLATYDFKARLMVLEGRVNVSEYSNVGISNWEYPPHIPLAYSLIYLWGAAPPKIVIALFYVSLVIFFYHSAGQTATRLGSLLATLALILTPTIFLWATHGMLDLPATYYLGAALCLLEEWARKDDRSSFLLAGMMLGAACWTRTNALAFGLSCAMWALLIGVRQRHWPARPWLIGLACMFGATALWQVNLVFELGRPFMGGAGVFDAGLLNLPRLWETLAGLGVQLLDPRLFGVVGWAFLAAMVLVPLKQARAFASLTLASVMLLTWLAVFYGWTVGGSRTVTLFDSGQRVLLNCIPILLLHFVRESALVQPLDAINAWLQRFVGWPAPSPAANG